MGKEKDKESTPKKSKSKAKGSDSAKKKKSTKKSIQNENEFDAVEEQAISTEESKDESSSTSVQSNVRRKPKQRSHIEDEITIPIGPTYPNAITSSETGLISVTTGSALNVLVTLISQIH